MASLEADYMQHTVELLKPITCFPLETLSTRSRMWDLEDSNIGSVCERGWLVNPQTYDAYNGNHIEVKTP